MSEMSTMSSSNTNYVGQFGDTTLTKVFVGGLAWETQKEALREHFQTYGEILEAVIISDKITGRSKGYGFVTFKEPESANKACEDATPMINGRRANCNLASLGARRPTATASTRLSSSSPAHHHTTMQQQQQQGSNGGKKSTPIGSTNQVQWYYQTGAPASPFYHHHQAVPLHAAYGYAPAYVATGMSYNPKLSYNGGSYMNGHYPQMYPVYPYYQQQYHQPQTMGLPTHVYPTTSTIPTLISKPPSMVPNTGTATEESQVKVLEREGKSSSSNVHGAKDQD